MRTFQTLFVLSLISVTTFAQGPDVIVGSLNGVSSYGSSGGIHAYSVGTTSCNVGNVWLNWFANTNQHPVIGQAFYRLKGGRFEQIGISWLKHGFFALSGSLCFNDCQTTNGEHLGVHCSDPYDAPLNGDQGGLGPRNEVNAATGHFPYPFTSPSIAPVIGRRLQCLAADVNPTLNAGALYWAEGQYVTPDDSAAGNKNNNASYRSVVFTNNATFSATLTGATVQQLPAIHAWQAADPTVVLTNVDVPNDGRFIVAKKVTDIGGGNFHYEFAVHNLTSHRSGRGFTVDFAPGTVISNVGFKDVPYHSGEPWVGTDWTITNSGNASVNWAGQTYIQNINANALRFGTTYNFWFDATAASETNKTIELWRPDCQVANPTPPGAYTLNAAAPFDNPTLTAPIAGPSGDDANSFVPIGFTFNYHGTNYTNVFFSTNGFLAFSGIVNGESYENQCLPNTSTPNNLIAGYWDDLVAGAGECQYQTLGSAPNRRFVASWTNVNIFNTGLNQSLKIILDETTNKITTSIIATAAGGSSGGAGATRGVENQTGTSGVLASCNVAGSAVAGTSQTYSPSVGIPPSADLVITGNTSPGGSLTWFVNSYALGAPLLLLVGLDPGPTDLGALGVLNLGLAPGSFIVLADGAGVLQPGNPADFTDACGDWTFTVPLPAGIPPGLTIFNQGVVITTTSIPPPPNGAFHFTDMEVINT